MNNLLKKLTPVILAVGIGMGCHNITEPNSVSTKNNAPVMTSQYVASVDKEASYSSQITATDTNKDYMSFFINLYNILFDFH
jgi:hypothetical protein